MGHRFFFFLCLGLLVLTTIKLAPRFFDVNGFQSFLRENRGHFLFFQMLNVSRLSMVASRFVSIYNSEKRKQIPRKKERNQSLTLAFNPFLFLYFSPKMRTYI